MCGIAGATLPPGATVDPALVEMMLCCLEHRGPDDRGWLSFAGEGFAHGREVTPDAAAQTVLTNRRLAIIDLSADGWQPMTTPDGRYAIAYNGEVYNYVELRDELRALGHTFRSTSDTEVILAALAQWGTGCLDRFTGMFALAVADLKDRRLVLARDPFGIKPLYYARWQGGLAFASEIGVLLRLPGIDRGVNPQRVYQYLQSGLTDHDEGTMLAAIRQLPGGHYLEVHLDRPGSLLKPVPYWSLDPKLRVDAPFETVAARLRELFLNSVRLHLRSDVPVGVSFSGGIDSSAIVTTMRQLGGERLELHAFSYIAEGAAINEEAWVDLVARETRATVHKVRPAAGELLDDLDLLIRAQGEPFRSTSVYAQFRVFRLAKEAGIKVMLDGQGADEILAGYRPYVAARIASCFRQARVREGIAIAASLRNVARAEPTRLMYQAGSFILPRRLHAGARRLIGADLVPSWMDADWVRSHGVRAASLAPARDTDVLRASLRQSVYRSTLPSLLRYEDRNSMAHSVESRVPFLTPELVQFCLSLPEDYLIAPDGTSKAVFREAMRGIVPDPVLDRRDKIGFETPEQVWMSTLGEWVTGTLRSDAAGRVTPLNLARTRAEWVAIVDGQKKFDSRVWRWVNVIRWAELVDARFDR